MGVYLQCTLYRCRVGCVLNRCTILCLSSPDSPTAHTKFSLWKRWAIECDTNYNLCRRLVYVRFSPVVVSLLAAVISKRSVLVDSTISVSTIPCAQAAPSGRHRRSTATSFFLKAAFHDTDTEILANSPDTPTSLRGSSRGCRCRCRGMRPLTLQLDVPPTSASVWPHHHDQSRRGSGLKTAWHLTPSRCHSSAAHSIHRQNMISVQLLTLHNIQIEKWKSSSRQRFCLLRLFEAKQDNRRHQIPPCLVLPEFASLCCFEFTLYLLHITWAIWPII